jgi:predicted nuclease of predicted toxin-antitoxin system
MKLLVDANLSPRVAARLRDHGHDATHVADHNLVLASDEAILRHAAETDCSIISSDSDFATMLALAGLRGPSLVLMRSADHLTPDEQADLLLANLPPLAKELEAGSVVSISMGHLRVRPLPMR